MLKWRKSNMNVNHYWRKKWWNEYGVKVKRIRFCYNPFNFWGTIPDRMYILYIYNSYGFIELLTYRVFSSAEEIDEYLRELVNAQKIEEALKDEETKNELAEAIKESK